MGFWVSLLVSLAITIVGELLRPKQKFKDPKPSALGDFQFPTADATRVIPVWWGTCKVAGPNTVWFGDLASVAIKKKVKTGWFSSTTLTQGFKYYLGAQLVYGYGYLDEMLDLRIDDKSVFGSTPNDTQFGGFDGNDVGWLYAMNSQPDGTGRATETCVIYCHADYYGFTMNSPKLLGADDPPEGVAGPVKVYRGTNTQPANDYLTAQFGEPEGSGFRPLIHVVFEHCYFGNSDTPPPVTLIGRRTPNPVGLTLGRENIKGDANAVNMCYEIMTSTIFGMKISPTRIDIDNFREVGNVLAAEGLGLSMTVDTASVGKDLLAEILRHIDGVIYPDPETGLYNIKLARADYDVDDIPVFTEADIDPDTFEFSRISWEETKNTTVVNYTDRIHNFVSTPVTYQDLANVFVRKGQIDSETIDFQGFSRAEQAISVAARANKTRSSPLCRLAFATNRRGYSLRPSSVIKVVMPTFGITSLIARVTDINYGTLDAPAVNVVTTEDIFSVNALAYNVPSGTSWVPPGGDPLPLAAQALAEAPHFGAPDDRAYIFTLASRASADMTYEVWSDPAGGVAYTQTNSTPDFTPSGLLVANYAKNGPDVDAAGFTINAGIDIGAIDAGASGDREDGKNLVLIGNEIMAWQSIVDNGDGTHTVQGVYRAVLDTVPEDHVAGDRVWFFSEGVGLTDPAGYGVDLTVSAKLLPANASRVLPIASATSMSLTTASRSLRPLPPGRVRVNSMRPVDIGTGLVSGTFAISWAYRNRNYSKVVSQSDPSVEDEPNVKYDIAFYNNATNALLLQKTGISADSADVALAFTGTVRVELSANRLGVASRVAQVGTFPYDAAGTTTSVIHVGTPVYVLDGGGA